MALHFVKLALMLLSAKCVASYCSSSTTIYRATTSSQPISNYYYSNNQDCTFSIQPSSSYLSGYFLEIEWIAFDVKGDMPHCYDDYVEVYLTSSYKSIGKYCSNNLKSTSLFKMYSSDGYAKIKFHSDGSNTGGSFKLVFQLKKKNIDTLGSSTSTYCSSSQRFLRSGNVYSAGWPESYARSYDTCDTSVEQGKDVWVKFAIMDVDLRNYNSSCDDYIIVRGHETINKGSYGITSDMCSDGSISSYTTKFRYITFEFGRGKGSSGNRGFMAGYVQYGPNEIQTRKHKEEVLRRYNYSSRGSSSSLGALIGGIIGGVVGLLLIILIPICLCKQSGNRRATVANGETINTVPMGGTNAVTGTTMQQTTTMPITNTNPIGHRSLSKNQAYFIPTQSQTYPQGTQAYGTSQLANPPASAHPIIGN